MPISTAMPPYSWQEVERRHFTLAHWPEHFQLSCLALGLATSLFNGTGAEPEARGYGGLP